MNPDVVLAIPALVESGTLPPAAALAWVARVTPLFSWQEVPSPNLAYDYILLLGILLVAADLAYCEVQLGLPASHRAWHLLIVAGLAGLAAFRCDSRVAFSLSLTTFAAWRGVALADAGTARAWGGESGAWRWNAIACGILFAGLGLALAHWRRKAHFEPVAVHLGCLLALGGIATGIDDPAWGAALLLAGAALAGVAYRTRRFPLFAYGVVAAYAGVTRLLAGLSHDAALGCLWFGASSGLVIAGLLAAHRRMKEPA